jgi:uncharacterized YigZ family protein
MSSPSGREPESYHAPSAASRGEVREKGSRFLAVVVPVADEAAATSALDGLRQEYRDATHVCWAWRLGHPARERSADAGEPAGTAGLPILQVLRGAGLSDALLAVVRWFGGTKLGKGGLARAYAAAAREALEGVGRVERVETVVRELSLGYAAVGAVKRLLEAPGVRLEEEQYGDSVRFVVSVDLPALRGFEEAVADLGPSVSLARAADC